MWNIMVIGSAGTREALKKSILGRSDFTVQPYGDFEHAFQYLLKYSPELFVAEHTPYDMSLPFFLGRIRSSAPDASLKGIILSKAEDPSFAGPPVTAVLGLPIDREEFNRAIARALHLKDRAHRRYLARMYLNRDGEGGSFNATAMTVNLSAGGMLIETMGTLPVGKTFLWALAGAQALKGLKLAGTVLKEEPPKRLEDKHHYFVIAFQGNSPDQQALLERYLKEQC